jgi:GcvH upstream region-like protein
MLHFVKKHQRKIFIVITVMTVSSFVFFGTFSTLMEPRQEAADRQIATSITGKPLMQREIYSLCQLLSTSSAHPGLKNRMPNLFNEGVIEKEFLSTGLSLVLAKEHFAELKPDLDARLKKMKRYHFYSHPASAHVGVLSLYQRFAPSLMQHLELLKKQGEECTLESLALMIQLYRDQESLPTEIIRQMLLFQQRQQGLPSDPRLAEGDLSLFGFTSLDDWFGPLFVEMHAQCIANAADFAKEKGYALKNDAVRMDLFRNLLTGYKRFSESDTTPTMQEMQQYYHSKMQQWGLDETSVLAAWSRVLLFKQLLADVGASVRVDPLFTEQFHAYSEQNATIALYELPRPLQFTDFQTLLKFQIYIESIAAHPQKAKLDLPREVASLDVIERRFSELVQRECEVEYAEVQKSALAADLSIKETWEWEASDAHWPLIQIEFVELKGTNAATRQERLKALDALDPKRRLAIDTWARGRILDAQPQKIAAALEGASKRTAKVSLRALGGQLPFCGVQDRSELISLLTSQEEFTFSGDQEHFYRIHVLQREEAKRILSFQESLSDGTLDLLLNRRLEEVYPEARKKNPGYYQSEKSGWKPLKEVKDQVGRYLFSDMLKAIEECYQAQVGPLPGKTGELPLIFYCNYRLFSHMRDAERAIQKSEDVSNWVGEGNSLVDQWLLKKSERTVKRSDGLVLPKEEIFHLRSGEWSPIQLDEGGFLAFYQVLQQSAAGTSPSDAVQQGQELLARDARGHLMEALISQVREKKALDMQGIR